MSEKPMLTSPAREELVAAAVEVLAPRVAPCLSWFDVRHRCRRQVEGVLDWLDGFPGQSWQQRWQNSGAGERGQNWMPDELAPSGRAGFWQGLEALVALGAIRPDYRWLLAVRAQRLWRTWMDLHDPEVYRAVVEHAERIGCDRWHTGSLRIDLARMSIATAKPLAELNMEDLLAFRAAALAARGAGNRLATTYRVARAAGLFADGPVELPMVLTSAQLTPTQLVDRHDVASPSMRGLLISYLTERSAGLDYTSLSGLAGVLVGLFWSDLERHHPEIVDHRLSDEQASAWKLRVRHHGDGSPRRRYQDVLISVRGFYLDLNAWAHEDPAQWAEHAAPCPIRKAEMRGALKARRVRIAEMHARTRTLAPLLPVLVRGVRLRLQAAETLLAAARDNASGTPFELDGRRFAVSSPDQPRARRGVWVRELPEGNARDVAAEEREAFWAWAVVEVLRHTGVRVEELLELTHYSIRSYTAADGQRLPLLQIAPSKTGCERVIPVSPELANALARVVARLAGPTGRVPLVPRYDVHERVWSPPLPHLFQMRDAHRDRAISAAAIRDLLSRATVASGLADVDGTPARLTPHDFRRIFATDAVSGGLPVHIAAHLLGHANLNTTQAYVAIYPTDVFRAYQQFIDNRRTTRPSEEYRAPTAAELAEFGEHFGARRTELGTCVRPYGTGCTHEHACIRCNFAQVDPDQMPRLLIIETDLRRRLDEAEQHRWLADVTGLNTTLQRLNDKKEQLAVLLDNPTMPLVTAAAPA